MNPAEFSTVESEFRLAVDANFESGLIDSFLAGLKSHFPVYSDWPLLRSLLVHIRDSSPSNALLAGIAPEDRPFAHSISHFIEQTHAITDTPSPQIREIGPELDFLAHTCFLPNLTPMQIVNLFLLRTTRPTRDAAIVVTMRDEGTSLLEWLAFNQAIGLTNIFVYSNDNVDGSDELLELLASAGTIKLLKNSIAPGTNPQRKAYQHAVHLLHELRAYRWVFFLDGDEFLVLDERFDYRIDQYIHHVEQHFQNSLPGAVVFPWDWRLSDLSYDRTNGLLFERYPHSISHAMVKSMTRLNAALGMCEVHIPTLEEGAALVDSALEPLGIGSIWQSQFKSRAGGSIAHFWGRSFEEFAVKKRRGDLLSLDDNPLLRDFRQYFEWTATPGPDNFRPAPPVLLERTNHALKQLEEIDGVDAASSRIRVRFRELCLDLQTEHNLRDIFDRLQKSVRPALEQNDPAR